MRHFFLGSADATLAHHYSTAIFFSRGGRQEQRFPVERARIDEHPALAQLILNMFWN